jgi:selenocysteine lyase/cysteine desulfurase
MNLKEQTADSAHGLGMLELDMKKLGVDFFASSPYKWLGAPAGCGLFYVRKEVQDKLWPTIATEGWDTYESAKKYETLGSGQTRRRLHWERPSISNLRLAAIE